MFNILNFQMILQGHYFGLQDTPCLAKIIKINDFAIFHVITLFYVRLFNYTILLYFYNICYQSRTFLFISHITFCYQSRTFLLSVTYFFVINTLETLI